MTRRQNEEHCRTPEILCSDIKDRWSLGTKLKVASLLTTKNKSRLKPHRLISTFIPKSEFIFFKKKGRENEINMTDVILRKLYHQRKYSIKDYILYKVSTLRPVMLKGLLWKNLLLADFHETRKNLQYKLLSWNWTNGPTVRNRLFF